MTNLPVQQKPAVKRPAKGLRIHTRRVKQADRKISTSLEAQHKPHLVKAEK